MLNSDYSDLKKLWSVLLLHIFSLDIFYVNEKLNKQVYFKNDLKFIYLRMYTHRKKIVFYHNSCYNT